MNFDKPLLDTEKQTEFLHALNRSRRNQLIALGLSSSFLFLAYVGLISWGYGITALILQFFFMLYLTKDFRYVYYHKMDKETLTLYLFNLRGRKTIASFDKADIRQFKLFNNGKAISTPQKKNKYLIVAGILSIRELMPIILKAQYQQNKIKTIKNQQLT